MGGRASATPPPPAPNLDPDNPRCAEHADIPATERGPDCWACGAVRRQLADQVPAEAGPDRTEAAGRRAAIAACTGCDDQGWRDTGAGLVRCDHAPAEAPS